MNGTDLLLNAAVSLAIAGIYGYVGSLMWRRDLTDGPRLASRLFGVWWLSLAFLYAVSGAFLGIGAFFTPDLALTVSLVYVLLIAISLALWGLLYYLLYVYTGSSRWLWPLAAMYAVGAFALVYMITWMQPTGIAVGAYSISIDYVRHPPPAVSMGITLAFSGPILLAAIAYASLFFQATGRTERFRIALVSGSFILSFGWSILSGLLQLSARFPDSLPLLVFSRIIALAGPALVLLAYRPPAALRRRLRIVAIDERPS